MRILFAAIFLVASSASANQLQRRSVERQFADAELVAIARLGSRETCNYDGARWPCAELVIEGVLKDVRPGRQARRHLILYSGIAESSLEGVHLNGRYLLFLREHLGFHLPVNGPYSVMEIRDSQPR
jgi:hypothetical protein